MAVDTDANRQVMLSLAYLAYCGDQLTDPDPDGVIGDLIAKGMEQIPVLCTETNGNLVPNWTQVWGPVSYTPAGARYQDSLMYLVQNIQDPSQYVIAIRGTNHVSDLDWLMDDLDVLQQMPWPPGAAPEKMTGQISESTSIALQVLLNMTAENQTLLQYLDSITGTALDLWVTGHSLGGCLASALGLYLTEDTADWAQTSGSTVSCVTFAAPTAGNGEFAALVDNAFSATTFDRVQCSFDIVPLAWSAANIVDSADTSSAIFDIYDQSEGDGSEKGIDFQEMAIPYDDVWTYEVLGSVLPMVRKSFETLNYAQPAADQPLLTGKFNDAFSVYGQDFTPTAEAFVGQMSYQHSSSYPNLLGVPQLLDPLIINENGAEIDASAPVVRPRSRLLSGLIVTAMEALKQERQKPPVPEIGDRSSSVR